MGLIKEKHFVLFWTLVGGLAAGIIWNLPWRFQVNDDEVMMWLVSGVYTGSSESYAVFLHPVLSWAFSVLYQLAPQVLWYPVAWFLCMFLSFSVLVSQVKKKLGGTLTAHVWSLFFFAFYVHFLFFLQFSIVAGFAIFTGLAARFGHLEVQDRPKDSLHFTDLFILFGFLIRPEVLFVFLAGVLVLNLFVVKSASLYRRSIPPILILVIGYGVSYVWIMNSGLQDFERLNRQRSSVFDHPVLQLNKEELKMENPDLYYFSNGLIDFQRDLQLIEKLPAWKEELDSKRWEWIGTESVAKSFLTYVEHEHFLLALIAVFLSFSLFSVGKRQSKFRCYSHWECLC